jgi:hypothetical protein
MAALLAIAPASMGLSMECLFYPWRLGALISASLPGDRCIAVKLIRGMRRPQRQ